MSWTRPLLVEMMVKVVENALSWSCFLAMVMSSPTEVIVEDDYGVGYRPMRFVKSVAKIK